MAQVFGPRPFQLKQMMVRHKRQSINFQPIGIPRLAYGSGSVSVSSRESSTPIWTKLITIAVALLTLSSPPWLWALRRRHSLRVAASGMPPIAGSCYSELPGGEKTISAMLLGVMLPLECVRLPRQRSERHRAAKSCNPLPRERLFFKRGSTV